MPMQVNVTSKVNSSSIRREQHNGREHFVIPSYTLPANVVMNGGLYPASEIDAHYKALEGTLAPLGHPTVNGKHVSAFSPEGINTNHVGAFNRNVKKIGHRVYSEKWVDIEFANNSANGRRLVERLEAIERGDDVQPIHTSIAVFLDRQPAVNSAEYQWVAKFHAVDHDAILLDEPGAATPEQGVGLMVNADQATALQTNAGALEGESFGDKQRRIEQAARDRFVTSDNDYVWIADFTDTQAVIVRNGGDAEVYGYRVDGGRIVFDDTGAPVERRESWVSKLPTVNQLFKLLFNHQARPDQPEKEGDMPLTKEEKAELMQGFGEVVANAVKPLQEGFDALKGDITTLQANQQKLTDNLTANQKAEDDKMREAVKAKYGEVVANSLQGEALKEMFKQCDGAAPILAGNASDQVQTGAPDPKTYGGV